MSGVFFRRSAAATGAPHATSDDFAIQQLLAPTRYRVHVQAEEITQQRVAAVPESDGLQAGQQTALLFIEQTIEQQDGGLQFVGRQLERFGVDSQRNGQRAATGQHLVAALRGIDGGIQELALDLGSAQPLLLHQMT